MLGRDKPLATCDKITKYMLIHQFTVNIKLRMLLNTTFQKQKAVVIQTFLKEVNNNNKQLFPKAEQQGCSLRSLCTPWTVHVDGREGRMPGTMLVP